MLGNIMKLDKNGDDVKVGMVDIRPYIEFREQNELEAIADGNYASIENDLISDGAMDEDDSWLVPVDDQRLRQFANSKI